MRISRIVLFRAVVAIHRGDLSEGRWHVVLGRRAIDRELTALVSESYSRAYGGCTLPNSAVGAAVLSSAQ